MPIIVSQIITPIKSEKEDIIRIASKRIGVQKSEIAYAEVNKISLDARKQNDIRFVSSVYFRLTSQALEKRICNKKEDLRYIEDSEVSFEKGKLRPDGRIIVAGFGPAGMMAALTLAENGYSPLVLERGASVDERVEAVEKFWKSGILDTNTNVQFGEGGAGTFSDGKLTTRINDPLCSYVLRRFTDMGAPEEILVKAKPHIGTDNLRHVVKNIRERIISLGGEIRFNTAVEDITVSNGMITSVKTKDGFIPAAAVILAVGHSARDTFSMLLKKNVLIEPKAFSVGARIEHRREDVNYSLYGKNAGNPLLPEGEYQLSYRRGDRAAYTFCMCPGGVVVPSASEENSVVVNGMSEFSRDKENSNSALVVSVSPDDFGKNPLDGVDFARKIEQKAYLLGNGGFRAPAVSVGAFLDKKKGLENTVNPSYSIGVEAADFDELFPSFVTDMMRDGIRNFSRKMKCFGDGGAVLTGAETRTSSPVRITRNDNRSAVGIANLFPSGEGAGYAGGIMSAAVDGIKSSAAVMKIFSPD